MWVSQKRFEELENKVLDYEKNLRGVNAKLALVDEVVIDEGSLFWSFPHCEYIGRKTMPLNEVIQQIIKHLNLEFEVTPATEEQKRLIKKPKENKNAKAKKR